MALDPFEWGGPDIGGPTASLDEALERRHGGDRAAHPPARRRNLPGPLALITLLDQVEFVHVYEDDP